MQALPILFEPPDLAETLPSSSISVERIFIAAFTATPATATGREGLSAPPGALSNPWAVYLVTDNGRSARIDPRASSSGASALQLTITLEDGPSDIPGVWGEVFRYELPVKRQLNVGDVLEAIEKGNFRRYRMHSSGHGAFSPALRSCLADIVHQLKLMKIHGTGRRYWTWAILSFLKEVGFIADGSYVNASRIRLQQVWLEFGRLAPEAQQTHMVHGSFIDVDSRG